MVRKKSSKSPLWSEGYKPRNRVPDPHKLSDGWYAFTINPCDSFQMFNLRRERFIKFIGMFIPWFNDECSHVLYYLYPELSKLGRLHFHGYLRVPRKNTNWFYTYWVPRVTSMCSIDISELKENGISKEYTNWEDYCTKQQDLFQCLKVHTNTCLKSSPFIAAAGTDK